MKRYAVYVKQEIYHSCVVEAKTVAEAEEKASTLFIAERPEMLHDTKSFVFDDDEGNSWHIEDDLTEDVTVK